MAHTESMLGLHPVFNPTRCSCCDFTLEAEVVRSQGCQSLSIGGLGSLGYYWGSIGYYTHTAPVIPYCILQYLNRPFQKDADVFYGD